MSHAYARNHIHIVFGTKAGRQCIHGEKRERLWDNFRETAKQYGVAVVEVGGAADHVHLLVTMPPKISVSAFLRAAKANASKWMNEEGHYFAWQSGYGAFSVSASRLESVAAFVRGQAEHHRRATFEEEFGLLLAKHGVAFTPGKLLG